jgi:hypothetical protein
MAASESTEAGQAVTAAIGALSRVYGEAAAAIEAIPDPQGAFESATKLADTLREVAEAAADLRARTVARIWEEEKVSLAALAERIGVSKARAGQLVQSAKKAKENVSSNAEGSSTDV